MSGDVLVWSSCAEQTVLITCQAGNTCRKHVQQKSVVTIVKTLGATLNDEKHTKSLWLVSVMSQEPFLQFRDHFLLTALGIKAPAQSLAHTTIRCTDALRQAGLPVEALVVRLKPPQRAARRHEAVPVLSPCLLGLYAPRCCCGCHVRLLEGGDLSQELLDALPVASFSFRRISAARR